MITLSLLHPNTKTPVQTWSFENQPSIRIGRAEDNDVMLYSVVVSRHHLEIRWNQSEWELVNLGKNGTYVGGDPITIKKAVDGLIFRIAATGPTLQIHIQPEVPAQRQEVASVHQGAIA